ncbi:hypothetical protein GCM10027053_20290 [Intrasporangium mesophilum]
MRQLEVGYGVESEPPVQVVELLLDEEPRVPGTCVGHEQAHIDVGAGVDNLSWAIGVGQIDGDHPVLDAMITGQLCAQGGQALLAARGEDQMDAFGREGPGERLPDPGGGSCARRAPRSTTTSLGVTTCSHSC